MTPTIKSITLSDGTRLEDRGEVRFPKNGDWFINRCGEAERASFTHETESTILSPVEAPAGGIERRSNFEGMIAKQIAEQLNALIDAACAVVNEVEYTNPEPESRLATLATTLEPFTQAVKEERFYADGNRVVSRYNLDDGAPEINFPVTNEATAKEVAQFLNGLAAEPKEGGE